MVTNNMTPKQTAVDFLEESIHFHCLINDTEDVMIDYNILDKLFMQAKKKEKEQIKKAYKDCHDLGHIYGLDLEEYYNETYGN